MKISKHNIPLVTKNEVAFPTETVLGLPEKVLQFGTGVFLRGLIDYIINKANNENVFNGRIVAVKSTNIGDSAPFNEQDNLYTLIMRSNENGENIEEAVLCASISRILTSQTEWSEVLHCASNKELKIIISNTTEIGIVLDREDDIHAHPPKTFPGKLLSFLYRRYKIFNGSKESGFIIIPTELITDNATKLKDILNKLALHNGMEEAFIKWLNEDNDFCNSLVDRIVPGKFSAEEHRQIEKNIGYRDDLMIMSETFGLWAIEAKKTETVETLSFAKAFPGVHILPDIGKFRELKLRILNGSHNLCAALGIVAGFDTVIEAMNDPAFGIYIERLITSDIAKAIVSDKISLDDAIEFGKSVLTRYQNPFIKFKWLDICVQDTSKIRIRAVPILTNFFDKYHYIPDTFCLGFAAYILFMKSSKDEQDNYIGSLNGCSYVIEDDFAGTLYGKWQQYKGITLVRSVLSDSLLWEADLDMLSGFSERVFYFMEQLQTKGFVHTVTLITK